MAVGSEPAGSSALAKYGLPRRAGALLAMTEGVGRKAKLWPIEPLSQFWQGWC